VAAEHPHGLSRLLAAADFATGPSAEIAVIGEPDDPGRRTLIDRLRSAYLPRTVVAAAAPDDTDGLDLLAHRTLVDGKAAAYVCINHACQMPVTSADEMLEQVRGIVGT
jgi:uncharacterized protein YyaL (SSP411 family)